MLHHRTFPTNHITNQSVWREFCWSIEVSWRQCYIIEHSLQIILQINQSHQNSVEVLRLVGGNVSLSNILYKSHYKSINLKRVLLKYWGELETILHHRTFPTNHITNQSVSAQFCWSIEVSWRQCVIIDHFLQITLQINQSEKSSVEVLRWVGDNVSSANIPYKSHYKSISLIKFLLKYWDELETMFHHRTFSTNHITNQSVSPEFCWSSDVSWRQCFIIKHSRQITLQINQSEKSYVEVLRWVGDNVSSSNIPYKSHYKSISLTRVLLKYWGELETMLHHRTFPINHITNQSVSPEFCWSSDVSWRQCFIIKHSRQITLQFNQSDKSSVEVLRWVGDNGSLSNILYKSHYK